MKLTDRVISKSIKTIILFLFVVLTNQISFAQEKPDSTKTQIDSVKLTKFNTDSVKKYFKASDTLIAYQLKKVEEYSILFNKINTKLRRGFDTAFVSKGLPETDSIISIARTNLTGIKGHTSLKILSTTQLLLQQKKEVLDKWQEELSGYNDELNAIKDQMSGIRKDSNLLVMPSDSMLFLEYIKKLTPLAQKITLADTNTTLQLKQLGILQNRVSSNYLAVTDLLDESNFQINNFSRRILDNEFGYIWDHEKDTAYKKDFKTVVQKSIAESNTLVQFYSDSNWLSRIIVLLIGIVFYLLMRRNILRINKQSEAPKLVFAKTNHLGRHLFTSTFVFSLMLIPFIYKAAPQAFTQSLWGLQVIALGFLLRNKLNLSLGLQILILLLLFYITGFTNLLIETTYAERWIQFFISFVSVLLGIWILLTKRETHFSKADFFKPLVIVFIIMNAAALILNIIGRVTLAKVLNTGANYGMIEAINLLVLVEIIIDAVYLSMEASKKSSRLTAYFEFKGMENKLRKGLGFFAALIWLVIFTQSLHVYDAIFGNISEFLFAEQQIGNMTFSFSSIAVFVLVIWVSTLISKMVSFVWSDHETTDNGDTINKLGSTMLLVRLGILSAGVLMAFGASGIPLDKLTIVIGALGVGIGFGLQNIVNNLVSGIVLAFEKPIQIGDIIEVGDRSGTVKEVGIRSSKLTTFDGSEVIVPNGDMLSQHLINWTRNNQNRRVILQLGVAYGSDIKKVKQFIFEELEKNKKVLSFPEQQIRVLNFGDNSVELSVYFWAGMDTWFDLKSDMMGAIYDRLNEEGISIPYPQRDLHIKTIDKNILTKITGKEK